MVIANFIIFLSIFVGYGRAISSTELAEIKKAIFEDEKMKGIDRQLGDNIMTTGELVTAQQHQETLMKTTLKNYNELLMETEELKLKYSTLEMYSKLSLPETCSALRKTGLNESVTAMINPAGLDKSLAAIQVQCDLPEDKTYLGKETKFEVTNCQSLRCYDGILDYKSSKEQIEALISSSVYCRQTIKLECISAPILDLVSTALLVCNRSNNIVSQRALLT